MSEKQSAAQWNQLIAVLTSISNGLWAINDQLKPLDNAINNQTTEVTKWLSIQDATNDAGFALVAEAIANLTLPPPQPTQRGTIMATFHVAADNPDITIALSGTDFTDAEGNPAGAADIDLTVESSNAAAVEGTLSNQAVSGDGNTVTADVLVHFGAPSSDVGVLTYKATNRDTGVLIAAGTDDFIVEAGEASVGTITSTVPLTPEP